MRISDNISYYDAGKNGTHPAYQGKGPVLNIVAIGPCQQPAQEIVTF